MSKSSVSLKTALCLGGVALAFAGLFLAGCSNSKDIAATFGDNVITESEVSEYTANVRKANGYEKDSSWSLYLGESNLTGKTWREQVIQGLATKILVKERAEELGITADEDAVAQSIEKLKASYGIDSDDQDAWEQALAAAYTTAEEVEESYRFSNIEEQVINADADIDSAITDEVVAEYIKSNLADQTTRRYSVLNFTSEEKATEALEKLKKLSGDELVKAFENTAETLNNESGAVYFSGDVGWDLSFTPNEDLDTASLKPSEMYEGVIENTANSSWQLYLCTGRFTFVDVEKLKDIPDKTLREVVKNGVKTSNWTSIANKYLVSLVKEANVQVIEMPSDLPYDLVPLTSSEDAEAMYPSN